MKSIVVILALVFTTFANAQKGTVLVAGSVQYINFNGNTESFTFSPKLGYQFSDKLMAGLELLQVVITNHLIIVRF